MCASAKRKTELEEIKIGFIAIAKPAADRAYLLECPSAKTACTKLLGIGSWKNSEGGDRFAEGKDR